jgi:antitoxin component of MazEF toxin-antitoxin module
MIELEVHRFGDALGVLLPEDVTARLGISDGASICLVETPDGGYRLVPCDRAFTERMSKVEDIVARYRNTLRILAS